MHSKIALANAQFNTKIIYTTKVLLLLFVLFLPSCFSRGDYTPPPPSAHQCFVIIDLIKAKPSFIRSLVDEPKKMHITIFNTEKSKIDEVNAYRKNDSDHWIADTYLEKGEYTIQNVWIETLDSITGMSREYHLQAGTKFLVSKNDLGKSVVKSVINVDTLKRR